MGIQNPVMSIGKRSMHCHCNEKVYEFEESGKKKRIGEDVRLLFPYEKSHLPRFGFLLPSLRRYAHQEFRDQLR